MKFDRYKYFRDHPRVSSKRMTEKEILTKFKKGAAIETDREMSILRKWALVGLVRFGVDFKNMTGTASLTKRGKWILGAM